MKKQDVLWIYILLFSVFISCGGESRSTRYHGTQNRRTNVPVDNTHYNVMIFPVASDSENGQDFANRLYDAMLSKIKALSRFTLIPFSELQRLMPNIQNSSHYNGTVKPVLANKLNVHWLITTKVERFSSSKISVKYTLTSVKTSASSSSTVSGEGRRSVFNSIVRNIGELREQISRSNAFALRSFQRTQEGRETPDDGHPKWTVCILPVSSNTVRDENLIRNAQKNIDMSFRKVGYIKLLTIDDVKQIAPHVKTSKDYNDALRKRLHNELQADFIILIGMKEINRSFPKYSFGIYTVIAHSGKTLAENLQTDSLDYIGRGLANKFIQLRRKINQAPVQPMKNKFTVEWERELGNIERPDRFQYPSNHQAGTIIETPFHQQYPYYLHLPPNYQSTGYSYPLLVYLHGARQRSNTLSPIMMATSPFAPMYRIIRGKPAYEKNALKLINKYVKGSIVLIPQVPERGEESWDPIKIHKLVLEIIKKYPVNIRRVYVMGISLGGTGTWRYGAMLSTKLAAMVPICGANPFSPDPFSPFYYRPPLMSIPLWAFHAFNDDVLSYEHSTAALEAFLPGKLVPSDINLMQNYPHRNNNVNLPADSDYTIQYQDRQLGAWKKGVITPRGLTTFTLYRTGKHDAWTPTYANENFWKWLYNQRR